MPENPADGVRLSAYMSRHSVHARQIVVQLGSVEVYEEVNPRFLRDTAGQHFFFLVLECCKNSSFRLLACPPGLTKQALLRVLPISKDG